MMTGKFSYNTKEILILNIYYIIINGFDLI